MGSSDVRNLMAGRSLPLLRTLGQIIGRRASLHVRNGWKADIRSRALKKRSVGRPFLGNARGESGLDLAQGRFPMDDGQGCALT